MQLDLGDFRMRQGGAVGALRPVQVFQTQSEGPARIVRVTENSEALLRMQSSNIARRELGLEGIDGDAVQQRFNVQYQRNLIASIIDLAIYDLDQGLRSENPRIKIIKNRRKIKALPNTDFDSAVMFLFGGTCIAPTKDSVHADPASYSPFDAYCALMGWSASQFRQKIRADRAHIAKLDELITEILGDELNGS